MRRALVVERRDAAERAIADLVDADEKQLDIGRMAGEHEPHVRLDTAELVAPAGPSCEAERAGAAGAWGYSQRPRGPRACLARKPDAAHASGPLVVKGARASAQGRPCGAGRESPGDAWRRRARASRDASLARPVAWRRGDAAALSAAALLPRARDEHRPPLPRRCRGRRCAACRVLRGSGRRRAARRSARSAGRNRRGARGRRHPAARSPSMTTRSNSSASASATSVSPARARSAARRAPSRKEGARKRRPPPVLRRQDDVQLAECFDEGRPRRLLDRGSEGGACPAAFDDQYAQAGGGGGLAESEDGFHRAHTPARWLRRGPPAPRRARRRPRCREARGPW